MWYKNISFICFFSLVTCMSSAFAMHIKKSSHAKQRQSKQEQSEEWYKASFLHACMTGNVALVDSLIGRGANVNIKGDKMFTPLHIACKHGFLELARFLMLKGADLNVTTNDGMTPLHCAVIACHASTACYLIRSGADINACTYDNYSVFDFAYKGKDICMAALLESFTDANESGEGSFELSI